jgi:hypothetical protein
VWVHIATNTSNELRCRADALLRRVHPALLAEVDELLTDACAAALMLEADQRRLERELASVREVMGELWSARRARERNPLAADDTLT